MPPPLEPKKRGKWLYIAVAGVIIAGVCCVLGIVALVVAFNLQKKAAPVQAPLGTTVPVDLPPATILPIATIPPVQPADSAITSFSDDFSNSDSGWLVQSTDNTEAGYNPLGFYKMAAKKADYYLVAASPDSLPRPLTDVIIKVRAQPAPGNTGDYGVVCR